MIRSLLPFVLAAFSVSAAVAQTPVARDSARLDPVVVTAARASEPASSASATVTVLRGDDLRERGVTSVADALREVPGLAVVATGPRGGSTSLFARGGNSNFVKVLVDGVSLNEAGGAFDFASLRTTNVERIEIVRGPASVLYGSDAVSGVVQIFTRQGGVRSGAVEAKAGSRETAEARAEFAGGRALRWSAGAAHLGTRGVYDLNNRYRNDDASIALSGEPAGAVSVRATARFLDARYHYPTTGSGAPTDSNAYTAERRTVLGLELARFMVPRLEARVSAGWNDLDRTSDDAPNSPGDTSGFYSRNEAHSTRAHVDARLVLSVATRSAITVGVEQGWQRERNHGTSRFASFPPSDIRFDERRGTRAAFVHVATNAQAGIRATLGARVDDNDRFGTFGTWRASVAFIPVTPFVIRAAAGTAFREPAFTETFNTAFSIGDPSLSPERSRNGELGVTVRPASWLRTGLTAFAQRFENLIQYTGRADPLAPDYENLAAATVRGLELEAEAHRNIGYVSASATALRTRVTNAGTGAGGTFVTGQPLLRRPARSASATVGLRSRHSASLTVVHTGERPDRDFNMFPAAPVKLDAYTRLDAAAAFSTGTSPWAPLVTLRVENVADRMYENVFGFRTPRRTILVGVRAGF